MTISTDLKEPDAPQGLAKFRMKWPWLDHLLVTHERYSQERGNLYAGGITYFSVLGIFPLLMVGFAIAGVFLFARPELLVDIQNQIVAKVPGSMGEQVSQLVKTAVEQRSAVGVIGLLTALYSGLGWIGNLRDGLTAQWAIPLQSENFFKKKGKDLLALLGLFLAFVVAFGLTMISSSGLMDKVIKWLHLSDVPGMQVLLTVVSLLVSAIDIWVVMIWVIGYLPRKRAVPRASLMAAAIATVLLVIWIRVAAIYLKSVLSSPAGAVFGPIIGIMVFLFFTWRIILFCTAWAATSQRALRGDVAAKRSEADLDEKSKAASLSAVAVAAVGEREDDD